MKVLLINGSPNEHGCTYTALSETAETLQKHGIDTEILYLAKSRWRAALPAANAERQENVSLTTR